MSKTKTIFIILIVATFIVLVATSEYPNSKYRNINTPIEGNYLAY